MTVIVKAGKSERERVRCGYHYQPVAPHNHAIKSQNKILLKHSICVFATIQKKEKNLHGNLEIIEAVLDIYRQLYMYLMRRECGDEKFDL